MAVETQPWTYSAFPLQQSWTWRGASAELRVNGYWYLQGEVAAWELRHILSSFYAGSAATTSLKTLFGNSLSDLVGFCDAYGFPWRDIHRPSAHKALFDNPGQPIGDPFVRQEWTVNSTGAIMFLLLSYCPKACGS